MCATKVSAAMAWSVWTIMSAVQAKRTIVHQWLFAQTLLALTNAHAVPGSKGTGRFAMTSVNVCKIHFLAAQTHLATKQEVLFGAHATVALLEMVSNAYQQPLQHRHPSRLQALLQKLAQRPSGNALKIKWKLCRPILSGGNSECAEMLISTLGASCR